jgi:hypothetical protein
LNQAMTRKKSLSRSALEALNRLYPQPDGGDLVGKLIATSARQIFMFLVILSIVSSAIVAFIIYTLTLGKNS